MKKPCGGLWRIGTAWLAALFLCCTSLAGCGRQQKTGNLAENTAALEDTEQAGETAPGDDPKSFHYDPAPEVVSDPTQSSAEESPAGKEERCILTLQISVADSWLSQVAAGFNRQSDRYSIRVEECGWGEELVTCRTRMQVELIAGRGPDIFTGDVMPNTKESVLEKGILMDLAPLLDAAGITDETYFPAVRALSMGEHVYGICPEINPCGRWVLESVLGGREQPDFETLVDKLYSYSDQKAMWQQYADYYMILDYLLGGSEDLRGMIDWENGKCDFSGNLFEKILLVAKRYADPDGTGQTAVSGWYDAGHDTREEVESHGRVILNCPFDDGWYPYCNVYGCIMINTNTKYPEGAWEFIKYLLGEKGQNYVAKKHPTISLPANRAIADSYLEQLRKIYEEGTCRLKS